jgi:hypothetical protein
MVDRGIRLGFGFLALAVATSAGAQGNLDQSKTAAQLYASACATCHKSPQSVSKTKWVFGLESFLREHYTSSRESAAILAAYLKGQEKLSAGSQPRHMSQAKRCGAHVQCASPTRRSRRARASFLLTGRRNDL